MTFSTFRGRRAGCAGLAGLLLALAGPAAAQVPAWDWAIQSLNPTPTDNTPASARAVAADAAGRAYVSGHYGPYGGITTPATRTLGGAATLGPGGDSFVAQATAAGQWAWVVDVRATGSSATGATGADCLALATTSTGVVYAAGRAWGTAVQVGAQTQALGATGGYTLWVARLTAGGSVQALQVVQSPTGGVLPLALAPDPSTGGVVLAGTYTGRPVLGADTLAAPAYGSNFFVARLGSGGQWLGTATAGGGSGLDEQLQLAVGPAGQVALGSRTISPLSFGSYPLLLGLEPAYFVAQLSPANQWEWARGDRQRTGGNSTIMGLAYRPDGSLYLAGRGVAGTELGTTVLVAPSQGGNPGVTGFVARLTPAGAWAQVWPVQPTAAGNVRLGPLLADGRGGCVTLGTAYAYTAGATANLGPDVLPLSTRPQHFVARLDSAGQWRLRATVPQPATDPGLKPIGTALDAAGNFFVAGTFSGEQPLAGQLLHGTTAAGGATGSYGSDVLLARLGRAVPLAARPTAAHGGLAVFPRPAHGGATLRLPTAATTAQPGVVLDALGRTVRSFIVAPHATEVRLDLTSLAPGLYGLRVEAATGRLVVE